MNLKKQSQYLTNPAEGPDVILFRLSQFFLE